MSAAPSSQPLAPRLSGRYAPLIQRNGPFVRRATMPLTIEARLERFSRTHTCSLAAVPANLARQQGDQKPRRPDRFLTMIRSLDINGGAKCSVGQTPQPMASRRTVFGLSCIAAIGLNVAALALVVSVVAQWNSGFGHPQVPRLRRCSSYHPRPRHWQHRRFPNPRCRPPTPHRTASPLRLRRELARPRYRVRLHHRYASIGPAKSTAPRCRIPTGTSTLPHSTLQV